MNNYKRFVSKKSNKSNSIILCLQRRSRKKEFLRWRRKIRLMTYLKWKFKYFQKISQIVLTYTFYTRPVLCNSPCIQTSWPQPHSESERQILFKKTLDSVECRCHQFWIFELFGKKAKFWIVKKDGAVVMLKKSNLIFFSTKVKLSFHHLFQIVILDFSAYLIFWTKFVVLSLSDRASCHS